MSSPVILRPDGKPARPDPKKPCPGQDGIPCGRLPRVPSAIYGPDIHQICSYCGFDFVEAE
jgi:hypothetical protein